MEWTQQFEMELMDEQGAQSLRAPLFWSVVLHGALVGLAVASTIFGWQAESWGGPGGGGAALTMELVSSAGVPLPRPAVVTNSRVVDETLGMHIEEPPKPTPAPPPPTTRIEIPEFAKEKPPKYITRPSKVLENPTPPPQGAVPYGKGGAPAVPYGQFNMAGQTPAGMKFSGSGGAGGAGGDFGSRFSWYVEAVRRRVSSNWLQSAIDPSVRWAPRVVVTFQILRDGTITNLQILQSSGNASVDNSARRAILSSSPAERLPSGYSGNLVNVEFWFEFRR
ncbi:MAG: energy transducer TonB [Candidatus Acidiferrales bacterium]